MKNKHLHVGAAVIALGVFSQPVLAQSVDAGDIVVTARKREETILNVPVIASVLSAQMLESRQLVDLREVARVVPGLSLGEASGSLGTQVSLRGVGTSAFNVTVDASVALNIDGLPMTQSVSYASAMFDLQRIEVLKGPQSLFYGKNSPGGVIALRSADPTDQLEVTARVGYEFEAKQLRSELILSGPVSDTLKLRLAGLYDRQDGYFRNVVMVPTGLGMLNPTDRDWAPNKNYILRGTAIWEPSASLTARLKVNLTHDNTEQGDTRQLTSCPDGTGPVPGINIPFLGGANEDCKLNKTLNAPLIDPAAVPGVPNGGVPFKKLDQEFGTLELDFKLTPELNLASTSGYYDLVYKNLSAVGTQTTPFVGVSRLGRKQFTQEFRLESRSFSGPLNFMAGLYYEDGKIDNFVDLPTNQRLFSAIPTLATYRQLIDIEAYSAFGQLRWQVVPQLELAAGARWTKEKRKLTAYNIVGGNQVLFPTAVPKIQSDNVAPEFTVTYKPSDDVTIFGSYKVAYKSGSFDTTVLRGTLPNYVFGDEKGTGGEVGVKARMLDRSLLLNLAAFNYRYKGLQVGVSEPITGGAPVNRTLNAGSAKVYGAEFDATFAPRSIEGLTLNAAVAYTHGRFRDLHGVPCWDGQMVSEGCTEVRDPTTGRFTAQDLSGIPLVRAPKLQANFGFSYELPVGNDIKLRFGNSNQVSSRYLATLGNRRDFYQGSYFKTDATIELRGAEDRWELALIGKNLTNKLTSASCSASNAAAGGLFGGAITGGNTRGPAGIAEVGCFPDRGRELWVRVTLRPFGR